MCECIHDYMTVEDRGDLANISILFYHKCPNDQTQAIRLRGKFFKQWTISPALT